MIFFFFFKMDEAWPNAPRLEMDAWFFGNFDFLWKDNDDDDFFFFEMDEAWLNAPSSEINVNFEKSYCVGASIEQNLSKARSKSQN